MNLKKRTLTIQKSKKNHQHNEKNHPENDRKIIISLLTRNIDTQLVIISAASVGKPGHAHHVEPVVLIMVISVTSFIR